MGLTLTHLREMLQITIQSFLRQISKATCIIQICKYYSMKEMIIIITAIILITGGVITILGIQTASAGPISTSRSNIKALRTDASGDNSQATSQDVDTEIITSTDNTCSESQCSNTISISTGENTNDGSKQPP